MKRILVALIMTTIMATSLTACSASKKNAATSEAPVQIPNPFVTVDTSDEATKLAGFELSAPDTIDGYTDKTISVLNQDDKMIQISYTNDSGEIIIRKEAIGSDGAKDISGDYRQYANQKDLELNGYTVTVSGNDDGYHIATWSDDGFNYSIGSKEGLSEEKLADLIDKVN